MICLELGISRNRYVATRTRSEFISDCQSAITKSTLPLEILVTAFTGETDGNASSPRTSQSPKPGNPAPPAATSAAARARRSSRVYGWYKQRAGSNYTVFNLDTQNAGEFRQATSALGQSLSMKSKSFS